MLRSTNSAYKYTEQQQNRQKKPRKDEGGRVVTEPANIVTNQMSTIEKKLYAVGKHKPDPYERAEELAKQDKEIWRGKIIHENMFKSMSHGNKTFTKDKEQYGNDAKAEQIAAQNRSTARVATSVNNQERFKLARRGHGDPIGRYPEWTDTRQRAHT